MQHQTPARNSKRGQAYGTAVSQHKTCMQWMTVQHDDLCLEAPVEAVELGSMHFQLHEAFVQLALPQLYAESSQ